MDRANKLLINAAYIAGTLAVVWFAYGTIEYQLKRNACIAYHSGLINAGSASTTLGLREESVQRLNRVCEYYKHR